MAGSILECLTKFNQIILLIVNVFVAVSESTRPGAHASAFACVSVFVCQL